MKRAQTLHQPRALVGWLCCALWLACFVGARAAGAEPEALTLRVLTYNIHHGEGTDGRLDLGRIAAVIKSADADIVALQEVDQSTERSGGVDQLAKLSELTGLHGAFGKAMDYKGGGYGLAILARWPLAKATVRQLPGEAGVEPRIAFSAEVSPRAESRVEVIVTHLDHRLGSTLRDRQASALREFFPGGANFHPQILAGDFNAVPNSSAMTGMLTEWVDTAAGANLLTIPAASPRRKIDFVLVRPATRWIPVESRAIEEPVASDHRPVLAIIQLANAPRN